MRVAVIGMGSIGRRHAENLVNLGYRPIVYDTDLNACGVSFEQTPEWDTALSLQGLWEAKPAAVLICTPPDSHWALALDAIRNDCHCFIEKPLSGPQGHGVKDWKELAALADVKSLVNMVACNWQYHEGPRRLQKARELGFPHKPQSLTIWHYSYLPGWVKGRDWREHYSALKEQGGVLFEVGWHLVDLALWYFKDARLEEVEIEPSAPLGLDCDGYAALTLRHTAKQKTLIEMDWRYKPRSAAIIVEGDRAEKIGWHLRDSKGYDQNEMYRAEIAHFLECCKQRVPSPNPISQAVKVLEILLTAKEVACQT